ncbi:hypothetical protein AB0I34_09115 [Kribbella sp. NPDC050281]|uniref:hypothetical protein n=1 Tax=Kribbella sp. NPDC050281 TaxID=3155515 RepID=UPI0033E26866
MVHRYAALAESDLTAVVCATWPWQEAMQGGWVISPEVIRDHLEERGPHGDRPEFGGGDLFVGPFAGRTG